MSQRKFLTWPDPGPASSAQVYHQLAGWSAIKLGNDCSHAKLPKITLQRTVEGIVTEKYLEVTSVVVYCD